MPRPQRKPRHVSSAFLKLLSVLEVNGGRAKASQLGGRSAFGTRGTAERAAELGFVAFDGAHVVLLDAGRAVLTAERGR